MKAKAGSGIWHLTKKLDAAARITSPGNGALSARAHNSGLYNVLQLPSSYPCSVSRVALFRATSVKQCTTFSLWNSALLVAFTLRTRGREPSFLSLSFHEPYIFQKPECNFSDILKCMDKKTIISQIPSISPPSATIHAFALDNTA